MFLKNYYFKYLFYRFEFKGHHKKPILTQHIRQTQKYRPNVHINLFLSLFLRLCRQNFLFKQLTSIFINRSTKYVPKPEYFSTLWKQNIHHHCCSLFKLEKYLFIALFDYCKLQNTYNEIIVHLEGKVYWFALQL